MVLQRERWISSEEYLELDRASLDVKYEYDDGHMYAMSGGTVEHGQIAINMIRALANHFGQGPCRAFSSDTKTQVAESKYYYPDVTVSCNPEDRQRGVTIIRSPRLVMEVLSPSTETNDRGRKFRAYRACPSIQEYILVSSQHQEVEIYQRQGDVWVYRQFGPGQQVPLVSIGLSIAMADIYWLTDIAEQEPEEADELQ
jgi:Uma2 family endonuclease